MIRSATSCRCFPTDRWDSCILEKGFTTGRISLTFWRLCPVLWRPAYLRTTSRSAWITFFRSIPHTEREITKPCGGGAPENGSRITSFIYKGHKITSGKPRLEGLPATYTEDEKEAATLTIYLEDEPTGLALALSYTIFADRSAIARSARFVNEGGEELHLTTAMSLCLDLPDHDYDWMQFSGAWARERHLKVRRLEEGIQSVGSRRGHSSHEHNPFVILKRPHTDEFQGRRSDSALSTAAIFLPRRKSAPTAPPESLWGSIRTALTGNWSRESHSRRRRL